MPSEKPGRWMKSLATNEFWQLYRELPEPIKQAARRTYQIWKENPRASKLRFKKVRDVYSIRDWNHGLPSNRCGRAGRFSVDLGWPARRIRPSVKRVIRPFPLTTLGPNESLM
jgi:hypothetical protein